MIRKPAATEALFLNPGADPADLNSYRPCTVRSMTPKHYNITYSTAAGSVHHIRCSYASIYTRAEVRARTQRGLLAELGAFLRNPAAPLHTCTPAPAEIPFTAVPDDDGANMLSVIRCCLAAAEDVIKCHDPDTWRDWCCDLLNLLSVPDHMPQGDSDDFLLRAQCALTSRIETGHW